MRRATILAAALAVVALTAFPNTAACDPAAATGGYDIGDLMEEAGASWDLSELDAVILVDEEVIAIGEDGTRTTTVHRIVWMATELALDLYGDLRVAWNSATSTLEVKALRTWRDDRWWPHESELSETAIVPTTAYALRSADDYATMRETMLLHDGVELPCIVETVYEITERTPGGANADGVWVFSKEEPAVVSRFELSLPAGAEVRFDSADGVPDPSVYRTPNHGVGHAWVMRGVERRGRPLTVDPCVGEPYVAWSTWPDWATLGGALMESVDAGAVLTDALRDSVTRLTEHEPALWLKLEAVTEFIDETTRAVHYPDRFWHLSPRSASRTWETAYGHRLDRAVLGAALFRELGLSATPAFRGRAYGRVDPSVPTLGRFEGMYVWVEGDGVEACYDPESGTLARGRGSFGGRDAWIPSKWDGPRTGFGDSQAPAALAVALTLEAGEEGWTGSGFLEATGPLAPYGDMTGLQGETEAHLGRIASSTVDGVETSDIGVMNLSPDEIAAGFAVAFEPGEPDERGRITLAIGDPRGGALDALPGDVQLSAARRGSPVLVQCPVSESVVLRFHPGDLEVVRLPDESTLTNAAGRFTTTVVEGDDGWITVSRELAIHESTVPPELWPELRALLLAAEHERSRVIMLE